jgi:hypothetical protein
MVTKDTLLKDLSKEDLRRVQEALGKKGFYTLPDGRFGADTARQFANWKRSVHMGLPEVIGKESWALLSQPAVLVDWSKFSDKVSKYFTVGEVSQNSRERIVFHPTHRANVLRLAAELDKIREAWGKPIGVTSWYRPLPVNRRIGSGDGSQHVLGLAADIYPIGGDIYAFQGWLDKFWGNKALGYGAKKGFVHIDLRTGRIRWNY